MLVILYGQLMLVII